MHVYGIDKSVFYYSFSNFVLVFIVVCMYVIVLLSGNDDWWIVSYLYTLIIQELKV